MTFSPLCRNVKLYKMGSGDKDMKYDRVKKYLGQLTEQYQIPFWQCRVICKGQLVVDERSQNLDESRKYYYIYSMTKLVTSVAVMKLIEEGKLSLEDQVSKYLPEFAELMVNKDGIAVKAQKPLTVRSLISMQGGYDYNVGEEHLLEGIKDNPHASTRELIRSFQKRTLWFEPGEGFAYSLCYDVLGAVIECASGMRLGEYFREKIFLPLGMHDTTFRKSQEVKEGLFPLYQYNKETGKLIEVESTPVRSDFTPEYESGGAGLISTFEDYFKFTKALLEGTVLEKKSLQQIYQRCMSDKMLREYDRYQQWGSGYCFGVRNQVDYTKVPTRMSKANLEISGAAGSYAFWDLEQKMALLYFQHAVDVEGVADVVHHKIRDLIYEEM